MKLPRLTWLVCSLTTIAILPACQGKAPTPTKQSDAKTPADAKTAADAEKPPAPVADGSGPVGPADTKAPPPPAPSAGNNGLGGNRADPGWYRKTIFGDKGKVLDTKRSEADDQGRFSSLIRFELTDMTSEDCADHLEGLVGKEVTNLKREAKAGGRVQLSGSTDEFKVTFLCGTAEGKTIAYVSYSWT